MSGSVEKYGPTWRIRWEAGLKPDGRRKQRSKAGFRTRREADAALRVELERVRQGQSLDVTRLTVGQFLGDWLESKRSIRESTRRSYEGHIRVYLIPHIGHVPLTALRADHLDRMFSAIRSGELRSAPSIATTRRIRATLRTALNSAFRRRLIGVNPATQVELEAEPTRQRDIWSPAELRAFLDVASEDRLGAAFRLIAMTGLRRGECCGLRWSDVDLETGVITITQQLTESGGRLTFGEPKTRTGARRVSLDAETVAVLRTHRAKQATERLSWGPAYLQQGLVFCREDGSPLRPDGLSRRFITLSKEAGVPRIVLHALRHGHATYALAAGVDITVVSKRLGHSRSSFTADTYTRVLHEVDRNAADAVAVLVRGDSATAS